MPGNVVKEIRKATRRKFSAEVKKNRSRGKFTIGVVRVPVKLKKIEKEK
jgi:hypothetical protein